MANYCIDVTFLYTNTPHNTDIEACRKVWDSKGVQHTLTESLLKLLEQVFKLKNFIFNRKHFMQRCETAMDTNMVPSCHL